MKITRLFATATTLALTAGLIVSASSTPTEAAVSTAGACPTKSGVTVIVDFQSLPGGVVTNCAPGKQASGYKALQNAGFTVAPVSQDSSMGRFVCRINGQPTPQQFACLTYPPMNAYWSYWHASRGGKWQYSSTGADGFVPPEGSVEGWSYGAGKPPSVAPPAALPKGPYKASGAKVSITKSGMLRVHLRQRVSTSQAAPQSYSYRISRSSWKKAGKWGKWTTAKGNVRIIKLINRNHKLSKTRNLWSIRVQIIGANKYGKSARATITITFKNKKAKFAVKSFKIKNR